MTAGANRQPTRPRRAHDDAVPAPARPGSGDPDRWTRLSAAAAGERGAQPRRICQLCVQTLGVTGAGISLVTDTGNRGVVCATGDVSGRIEDLQFTLGEGPCIDAVRAGAPALVADLDEPHDTVVERWPTFLEGAGTAGARAVFAFPLRIGAITLGALDLYRDRPGELDGGQLAAALLAADAAAIALLHLDAGRDEAFADDLDAGRTYHLQVHQATGMVQRQLDVQTDEALLRLRSRAFATDRPLAAVATDVVQRRLRFAPEDQ